MENGITRYLIFKLMLHKILPVFFLPLGLEIVVVIVGAMLRKWIVVWAGAVL